MHIICIHKSDIIKCPRFTCASTSLKYSERGVFASSANLHTKSFSVSESSHVTRAKHARRNAPSAKAFSCERACVWVLVCVRRTRVYASVCMCVCSCVRAHVYVHACMPLCISLCMSMCISQCACASMCSHSSFLYMHKCMTIKCE